MAAAAAIPPLPQQALRVLFVDDDAKLLNGLSRICFSINPDIEVVTAQGAEEGLAQLAEQTFDAVVSDLHMPGMNGAEFLEEVRNRHPATLRFVLSGEAKPEIFLKASTHALRCFSKPCEIPLILAAIHTALATLHEIPDKTIATTVSNLGGMPACSASLSIIHRLLSDPNSDVSDVVDSIRKNPGIVARILKVSNSPFFGRAGTVSSLDDAVALLGMDSVACMITTQQLFEKIIPASESRLQVHELWAHCSFTSSIARMIGPRAKFPTKTCREAITAALLHDIGKLVLAYAKPAGYAAALTRATTDKIPLWQAECPIFQNNHADIGSRLLTLWGFPPEIYMAVANHHTPHRVPGQIPTAATLVHVADCLAHELQSGTMPATLDAPHLLSLGLPSTLEQWKSVLP
jgi:HD-like signal output (HDOD) protein/CheY-like chemotaxis protein